MEGYYLINKIIELKNASGRKNKISILKKYADDKEFCRLLYYTLNPLLTYNVSESALRTKNNVEDSKLVFFANIFECCEYLSRLRGIDEATIRQVKTFLYKHCEGRERELYIRLLSKTLRLGVTAKTVNSIIPNLIPLWEVQEAYTIEQYPVPDGEEFWVTEKLNGVRATFYNGNLVAKSGFNFSGLNHIKQEISWAKEAGIVLDGELVLKDKGKLNDNEAFRKLCGILNSSTADKSEVCYKIFDAVPVIDFEKGAGVVKYKERRDLLCGIKKIIKANSVDVVPVLYHGSNKDEINSILDKVIKEDKEGLMVNLNSPYKRFRNSGILKVKRFYTMDLPILRCVEGCGRLQNTLGAIIVNYKGNELRVGSGMSDSLRRHLWEQREELRGSLCEVKYKEVSTDKRTGRKSLQFPVFVRIRNDKTEVSYG